MQLCMNAVADFEGPSRLRPPPFKRLTDAVMILLISEKDTELWRVLNFDRSTVKCTLIDCDQWLSGSSRIIYYACLCQIRFRPVIHPAPHWESSQRSLRPLGDFRGHTSKMKGRDAGRGERGDKGREREGIVTTLMQIPGSAPARMCRCSEADFI